MQWEFVPANSQRMIYQDFLRTNLKRLFAEFTAATGQANTTASRVISGDHKFYKTLDDRDFRVGTYDFCAGRFSALWPKDLAWPVGIDRPAPIFDEPKTKAFDQAKVAGKISTPPEMAETE